MADTTKPNSLMENYWRRVREEAAKSGLLRTEPDRNVQVIESNKYIELAKKRFKVISEGKIIPFGENGFIREGPRYRNEYTENNHCIQKCCVLQYLLSFLSLPKHLKHCGI